MRLSLFGWLVVEVLLEPKVQSHHTTLRIGRGLSQWNRSPWALSWAAMERPDPPWGPSLDFRGQVTGRSGMLP